MHISNSHQYLCQRTTCRFPVWINSPSDIPVQTRNPDLQQQLTERPQGLVCWFWWTNAFPGRHHRSYSPKPAAAQTEQPVPMQNLPQASTCILNCTQDHWMLKPFRQSTSRHTSQHHLFLYDSIDRDITKGLLHAEQKSEVTRNFYSTLKLT